jgi:hypothetical protein
MYGLNKDHQRRDEIIDSKSKKYIAGIKKFDNLDLQKLELLIKENFLSLSDKPNYGPKAEDFYKFVKSNPDFKVSGYAVSPEREDYRISLNGVELKRSPTKEEVIDFVNLFRLASSFKCNSKTCSAYFDSSLISNQFR